jgi:pimeloyl-ACP methyl ester carboxylesterase
MVDTRTFDHSNNVIPEETGFLTNGDIKIHYRKTGTGPLMIFQHGFPDNEKTYAKQVTEFRRDHTVITPTLRGYPPSTIPDDLEDYDMRHAATDLLAIVDFFGADKAVMVGHDFGGGVVQVFTLLFPHRVSGLIMINSPILGPFYELLYSNSEQQEMARYTIAYHNYREGDRKDIKYVVRYIRDPQHRASVAAYLEENDIRGMMNHYKKTYPAPPYDQEVDVSGFVFSVPTLILWGLEEEYFHIKFLDGLHRWFTKSVRLVTIPGAGHWAFRDKPELVNREIRSWLECQRLEAENVGI